MSVEPEPYQHIPVRRLPHARDLPLPAPATPRSSGLDLLAAIAVPLAIEPGDWKAVPTGIALALPPGTEGQLRPRSGLALRHGITLLNSPGTIDADYRGEIKAVLINHGKEVFWVERAMRIAQLVVARYLSVKLWETDDLEATLRGSGGFGSTGLGRSPAG
ncbi:MAG TPA: dUTP diphosphatase [Kiloniellales bacterium]|nr:dUTP diphosphatase [Kiloniellales bacterium]